eukprot:TCONS_00050944-protein
MEKTLSVIQKRWQIFSPNNTAQSSAHPNILPLQQLTNQCRWEISHIPLTRKDFKDMIGELDNTSAAGPDGFPAIFLKHCKKSLSRPLLILWRKCLDTGKTPETLKKSLIVPIHKGGH